MKKLINAPDDVVRDALRGHGGGARRPGAGHLRPATWSSAPTRRSRARSGLISGGGSGHEPMHGGFVGPGMLDAACPGEVFTSPTPDQMLEATKAVNGGAGRPAHRQELHRRRHELRDGRRAWARARASRSRRSSPTTTSPWRTRSTPRAAAASASPCSSRRSAARAADDGKSLAEVAELGRRVNANGRSMGMALTPCITPGVGRAELRARRRRGRDRHRHPRRAGPLPREASARPRRSPSG